MPRLLLLLLATVRAQQQGAEYLETAIGELKQKLGGHQPNRRVVDLGTRNSGKVEVRGSDVPPIALTKGELADLYERAVNKGKLVTVEHEGGPRIHAAVHEIEEAERPPWAEGEEEGGAQEGGDEGYYYYYYPLKSFVDEMTSQPLEARPHHPYHAETKATTPGPIVPQYHSHTHQHKVEITQLKEDKKSKALEPLFMAISGFVGMALMFVVSMVVLPKLGMKSRNVREENNPQVASIVRIALQAIEGHDCRERIACELGKTARAFNLYDNRFVKLFKRMVPAALVKKIDKVGKYTDRKLKCANIQCKKKKAPPKKLKAATKKT